jgi:hypothetical protein
MITELEEDDPPTFAEISASRLRLPPSPESARAGLSGLDADSRAFAEISCAHALIPAFMLPDGK